MAEIKAQRVIADWLKKENVFGPVTASQELIDALRAAGYVIERGWQPLSSYDANEGDEALLRGPDYGTGPGAWIAHARYEDGRWIDRDNDISLPWATEARPLPAPPKDAS